MKKIISLLLVLVMLVMCVACAKTEPKDDETPDTPSSNEVTPSTGDTTDEETEDFDYESVDLSEYIKLADYKGLTATLPDDKLTDSEFETGIANLLSDYADYPHITDRAVEEGDTVVMNYAGQIDGEDLSGGTAVDQEVVAADGQGYIDGFGSGLIGHMPGTEFEIHTKFPDPYPNNPDISGKDVVFKVTVKYIKGEEIITPEITPEWVKENLNYDTVEDFYTSMRNVFQMQKTYSCQSTLHNDLFGQICDNSEVIKYPTAPVEKQYKEYKDMYEYYASYYGTDYDTFLATYVGTTDADLYAECEQYVKEDLVLYALTKALDSKISENELAGKIQYIADMYNTEASDILSYYGEETMKQVAQFDKNMAIVASFANIVDGAAE